VNIDAKLRKIRGQESAFEGWCLIDPEGAWWSRPTMAKRLKQPQRNVTRWTEAWLKKGIITSRPGSGWRRQYRRLVGAGARLVDDANLPAAGTLNLPEPVTTSGELPTGYSVAKAKIARFGQELVAILENRRDNSLEPRFRLGALSVLVEFDLDAAESNTHNTPAHRAATRQAEEEQEVVHQRFLDIWHMTTEQLDKLTAVLEAEVAEKYGADAVNFPQHTPTSLQGYLDEDSRQR
jgi:hypothetical protein